jgi:hypothetical protein
MMRKSGKPDLRWRGVGGGGQSWCTRPGKHPATPPRLASLSDPLHKGEGRTALLARSMYVHRRGDAPQRLSTPISARTRDEAALLSGESSSTAGRAPGLSQVWAEIPIMAATNKCLAQSNKSRSGVEATKKRKRQGASGGHSLRRRTSAPHQERKHVASIARNPLETERRCGAGLNSGYGLHRPCDRQRTSRRADQVLRA